MAAEKFYPFPEDEQLQKKLMLSKEDLSIVLEEIKKLKEIIEQSKLGN